MAQPQWGSPRNLPSTGSALGTGFGMKPQEIEGCIHGLGKASCQRERIDRIKIRLHQVPAKPLLDIRIKPLGALNVHVPRIPQIVEPINSPIRGSERGQNQFSILRQGICSIWDEDGA